MNGKKAEVRQAYSDYRALQRQVADLMGNDDDPYSSDDDLISALTNDYLAAWGKYWDLCVKMSSGRYREFKGRKRGLRYAKFKYRTEGTDIEKLLTLDTEYLARERLPLPGLITE